MYRTYLYEIEIEMKMEERENDKTCMLQQQSLPSTAEAELLCIIERDLILSKL